MSSRTRYPRIAIQDDEVDGQFRLGVETLDPVNHAAVQWTTFQLPLEIIGVE